MSSHDAIENEALQAVAAARVRPSAPIRVHATPGLEQVNWLEIGLTLGGVVTAIVVLLLVLPLSSPPL